MPKPRRLIPVALAILLGLSSNSCFFTKRVILRQHKKVTPGSAPPLLAATKDDLIKRITDGYNAIRSFQAKVDLTPSVGSVYTGQITEIKDVSAVVLFRKPTDIRILGYLPVVHSLAFDMVSNGQNFRMFLVSKNLFIEGDNNAPPTSKNKLENLRPEAFLSSMMIRPPDSDDIPVLEDATDEDDAIYVLHFIRKTPDGGLAIGRNVWFDRVDLSIVRQKVLDPAGGIVSDTRYSKWQSYSGAMFPAHIDLNRVEDGYGLVMDVTEMKMNAPLTDEQFVRNQPEGSQLQVIGRPK